MEYLQYSNHTLGLNQLQELVLNLIINGIPSILTIIANTQISIYRVLNLIINGIPSIQ